MPERHTESEMIRSLKKVLKGPLSVSILNEEDLSNLQKWIDDYQYLADKEKYAELMSALDFLLLIRSTTAKEKFLYETFKRMENSEVLLPERIVTSSCTEIPMNWRGKNVCLIPPFNIYSATAVQRAFRKRGAVVMMRVDPHTDYVIEGTVSRQSRTAKGVMEYREYKKLVAWGYPIKYLRQEDIDFLNPSDDEYPPWL